MLITEREIWKNHFDWLQNVGFCQVCDSLVTRTRVNYCVRAISISIIHLCAGIAIHADKNRFVSSFVIGVSSAHLKHIYMEPLSLQLIPFNCVISGTQKNQLLWQFLGSSNTRKFSLKLSDLHACCLDYISIIKLWLNAVQVNKSLYRWSHLGWTDL